MEWTNITERLPRAHADYRKDGKASAYFSNTIEVKIDNKIIEAFYGIEIKAFFRDKNVLKLSGVTHWRYLGNDQELAGLVVEDLTKYEKLILKVWDSVPLPFNLRNELEPTVRTIKDKKLRIS